MEYRTRDKLLSLLINISIGILGFWLMINPSSGVAFFRVYAGIILLIGAISLFYLYNKSVEKNTTQLVQAIVLAVLGIVFLVSSVFTTIFLGVVLMIWVVLEGFISIKLALAYNKFEYNGWWMFLLYGIGALGLGIYLLLNLSISGNALIVLIGLFTLVRSVFAVIDTLLYKKRYYSVTIK